MLRTVCLPRAGETRINIPTVKSSYHDNCLAGQVEIQQLNMLETTYLLHLDT